MPRLNWGDEARKKLARIVEKELQTAN